MKDLSVDMLQLLLLYQTMWCYAICV